MTSGQQQARLVEVKALNPEVGHYVFESLGGPVFEFHPGQHVCLSKSFGGTEIQRFYSVASAPDGTNRFAVCCNPVRDSSPFGEYLRRIQPGEVVTYSGPAGNFRLNQPLRESVFIAHGTGITPIRSMLHHLLQKQNPGDVPLMLLYGARNPKWLFYEDEFRQLASQHPNFRFWPTLSRPVNGWEGRQGYVQAHLDALLKGRQPAIDFYLCGRPVMIGEVCRRLRQAGFDESALIYEKFS